MLKTDPESLMEEIEYAERHRDAHLAVARPLIEGYVGAFYREDKIPDQASPENHAYEYISLVLPRIIFDNPAVAVKSKNQQVPAFTAVAIEHALNKWVGDCHLQDTLEIAALDAMFAFGVVLTTLDDIEDDDHLEDDELRRMMPVARTLDPRRYFRDPTSTPYEQPRYEGHVWVRDKDEVLALPGVDKKAIEKLVADSGIEKLHRPNDRASNPPREEIVGFEVWVPDCNEYREGAEAPNCCHGTIFTLAVAQAVSNGRVKRGEKAAWIRKPRAYFGPPTGPYTMFGFYRVPGQTYPLSPISVTAQQAEELNAHATAVSEAAARMKDLVFVNAQNQDLKRAIADSADGSVIGVNNLDKDGVVPVTIGGPSQGQMDYTMSLRDRLDRNSGITDAQRGNIDPQATATQSNIAAQASTIRLDYLKKRMAVHTHNVLETVAWYMFHSHNVVIPLGPDAGKELGMQQPVFHGGVQEEYGEQPDQDLSDMELVIEPYSMERVDEHLLRQNVTDAIAIVTEIAQQMPQMPWLNWELLLEQLARVNNFRWIEQVINADMFKQFMQQQGQQQQQVQGAQMQMMQEQHQAKIAEMMARAQELLAKARAAGQPKSGTPDKRPTPSVNYKDVPEDIKRQIEREFGFVPSQAPLTAAPHVEHAHQRMQQRTGFLADRLKAIHNGRIGQSNTRLAAKLKASGQKAADASGMRRRQAATTRANI